MIPPFLLSPFFIPRNEALSFSEVQALDWNYKDLGFKLKIWGSVGNFSLILYTKEAIKCQPPDQGWRMNQLVLTQCCEQFRKEMLTKK